MTVKSRFTALSLLLLILLPGALNVSAGSPIGGRFLIYDDTLVNEALPALAYNSQRHEFLVVWEAETIATSAHEVWGRRVSAYGAPLSAAFRISAEGSAPDVAYNSATNEFLVVWHHDRAVLGQRITALGALQGAAFSIATGFSIVLTSCNQPAVTYASTANRYLVVFRFENMLNGGSAIKARSYLADGAPDGASFDITAYNESTDPEQPAVAYNRSRDEALVAWQETYPSTGDLDILARRVAFTGGAAPLDVPFYIISTTTDELLPAVAAIPTTPDQGQYLVTYQVDPDTINHDIAARTVSGTGVVGAQHALANTGWSELRPSVAGCEGNRQFFVTWVWIPVSTPPAMMQVQARSLALDGAPLHATTTVAGGQVFDAAVAAGAACNLLIAFDDNATFGSFTRGIYGQHWGERVYLPLVMRGS